MRMLRRELTAGARGHPDHQWNIELAARHVKDRRRVVDDLIQRQQAEVNRHDLDNRSHAVHRRSDSGPDERRLGQRCVPDSLGTELVEQSLAHRVASAVSAYILAHQENARVAIHRIANSLSHGFAVSSLHFGGFGAHGAFTSEYAKRVSSSSGSQVPASANAIASSISAATSSSMSFSFASSRMPSAVKRS